MLVREIHGSTLVYMYKYIYKCHLLLLPQNRRLFMLNLSADLRMPFVIEFMLQFQLPVLLITLRLHLLQGSASFSSASTPGLVSALMAGLAGLGTRQSC